MASHSSSILPPLSDHEYKLYNRLADKMRSLRQWFRVRWNIIYDVAASSQRPAGMSIKHYLNLCLKFCENLETHHKIEEIRIFPYLATRMPAFANQDQLIEQHKVIHKGLERLESHVRDCLHGNVDLRWNEVKEILDAFGTTLWEHLDDEVRELGAEQTRKYWSKDDENTDVNELYYIRNT
ncbi:unnamed protein product [Penicillium glandicola]